MCIRDRSNGQGARIVSSTGTYPARDPFRLRLRSLQILRAHLLMGNIFISSLLHSHSSPRIVSSVLGRWLIYSNAIRPGRGKVGEVGSHSAFPYGKFSITREWRACSRMWGRGSFFVFRTFFCCVSSLYRCTAVCIIWACVAAYICWILLYVAPRCIHIAVGITKRTRERYVYKANHCRERGQRGSTSQSFTHHNMHDMYLYVLRILDLMAIMPNDPIIYYVVFMFW